MPVVSAASPESSTDLAFDLCDRSSEKEYFVLLLICLITISGMQKTLKHITQMLASRV